jgi:Ca2+-binding RTX toxin-like protein
MGVHALSSGRRWVLALAITAVVLTTVGVAIAQRGGSSGGPASKVIEGTSGPDLLVGTKHADVLNGRRGADVLKGRGGSDRLRGGRGGDLIQARDHRQDSIDCGRGNHDVAVVDRAENGVFDCEKVKVPHPGQKRKAGRR